jgi:hypothetical protein
VPGQQWDAHDSRDSSEDSTNSDDGYSSNEWSASECNMFALNERKRELEGGRSKWEKAGVGGREGGREGGSEREVRS